ncbi:MAG TPA: hypothetical protein VF701_17015 [Thermoanaerobaculia bacterium]
MFPTHISRVLDDYGVRADTKAALYAMYVSMGAEVLDVFADIAESSTSVAALMPEETEGIRLQVIERFVRKHHGQWVEGKPTASLWHPRDAEGRAAGAVFPLTQQSVAAGVLVLGRNAHRDGRSDMLSFDLVAEGFSDALALATAPGGQWTLPGSVGATSAVLDSARNVVLIIEIEPNVGELPSDEGVADICRRLGDWRHVTLSAALDWLEAQRSEVFILKGGALDVAREERPGALATAETIELHDRTVERVVSSREAALIELTDLDELSLLDSSLLDRPLRRHVLEHGTEGSIWKVSRAALE